ncbi:MULTISPECIES: M23 family metallopeptidase [unclassified Mycobacterium]|uniref:M23 family metallopeptidase n=1 Tax=unclassified Mycobacterium TaxID=2642494 RepID=UPI0029C7ABB6|nr:MULTISPECIES: M23 family metallopeptidase [unclassified Mycobacterium]
MPSAYDATITDIIPFNEFGDLDDLDFSNSSAFDRESRVIRAPELDDLHDTDDLVPFRLAVPSEFQARTGDEPKPRAYRASHTDISDGMAATDIIDIRGRSGGSHRKLDGGHVKGRLVAAAMAVGATAAAGYSMANAPSAPADDTMVAAGPNAFVEGSAITGSVDGMQIVSIAPVASAATHNEEFANGAAFAAERAEREARLQRPLFVMPTRGVWTSGFGYRWGVLHGGIDIANSIGTPIVAAADGVVIDAGPTAGYGAWVKLKHADGTVTLYGHVNTWLVSKGQRVMAGDQIATIGNRGNSTGPHLHFEVLLSGTDRVDPVPWLAQRGLTPGKYVG